MFFLDFGWVGKKKPAPSLPGGRQTVEIISPAGKGNTFYIVTPVLTHVCSLATAHF